MKVLKGFQKIDWNGMPRIAYIYSEVDDESGDIISDNNRGNFVVTDGTLKEHVAAIDEYITEKHLS